MPELSILMPVFNERPTIETAIGQVMDADLGTDFELVVVDDGSTDGTEAVLSRASWSAEVRIVRHERNQGKGAAIRTGLAHARGDWTVIMDADLEYHPADIADVLAPLRGGEAEVVFGTRGFQAHSAYGFWYVLGNKSVTMAANLLFNSWLSDIMTCHKAMRTELFRSLDLRENGFGIEPEITARLLLRGIRIFEVPVVYSARSREAGKKLTVADGFRVLLTLLRCRLESWRGSA